MVPKTNSIWPCRSILTGLLPKRYPLRKCLSLVLMQINHASGGPCRFWKPIARAGDRRAERSGDQNDPSPSHFDADLGPTPERSMAGTIVVSSAKNGSVRYFRRGRSRSGVGWGSG